MKTRTVRVDYLARVEGEGAFHIKVKDNRVVDSKFNIFEPPRFFEAFLRGRRFDEAPDITARICGICPIAYQSSSIQAMEEICGVKVTGPLRDLRRLIYCGEWIESHVLHVYMLHLPDFLGYEDAIRLAKDHPDAVKRGLRLKKLGNHLVKVLGGREIHPINMRVGGFYRAPSRGELEAFLPELEWAREASIETIRSVSQLEFPKFERDYEFVSLRHPDEYPMNEGRLVSNKGLDIPLAEYFDHFEERHVSHSNALQAVLKARGAYHVGPLARYNLNFDRLFPSVQQAAREAGLSEVCRNPFKSIMVRSIETLQAVEEAARIIEGYQLPEAPAVKVQPREGVGYGCTEAPRGICFHRYRIDSNGIIQDARIIPPTSQNQVTIEEDLLDLVSTKLALPQEKLTWLCEQAIRNYDPCISCATHFLKLTVEQVA